MLSNADAVYAAVDVDEAAEAGYAELVAELALAYEDESTDGPSLVEIGPRQREHRELHQIIVDRDRQTTLASARVCANSPVQHRPGGDGDDMKCVVQMQDFGDDDPRARPRPLPD